MDYLKSAIELKKLISETNTLLLKKNSNGLMHKNIMRMQTNQIEEILMDSFTDEFVVGTLKKNQTCSAFVITDFAEMEVHGKKFTYFLYKGYHKRLEKAMVYFQLLNDKTIEPVGNLQFSNSENNIFFDVKAPNFEESSCNAIETKNHSVQNPEIAFLIGHINTDRLLYDIQRLIVDTATNVSKNPAIQYNFILQVSVFGQKQIDCFLEELKYIQEITKSLIESEFSNTKFIFEYDE